MIIYKLTFPNGKCYIGRTSKRFFSRMAEHKYKSKKTDSHLYRAVRLYGWDTIQKEIICEVSSLEELILKEREFIDFYNSIEDGYNSTKDTSNGGNNWEGRENTLEYKEFCTRMKTINTGANNGMYGRKHEDSTKKELKEKAKGRYTLEWFQQRYGQEVGLRKYQERNEKLSSRDLRGKNNPSYKDINLAELDKAVRNPNLTLKDISNQLGVTSTVIYRRFKQIYNCSNLVEVRLSLDKG